MEKVALSDDLKNKLKTTGKVVALGAAGATLGSALGSKILAKTSLGRKAFTSRPVATVANKLGASIQRNKPGATASAVGGVLGAHAFGVLGDFAGVASGSKHSEKRASMNNRYLEKLAGLDWGAKARFLKSTGDLVLGAAKSTFKSAIKTPIGKGVAIGAGIGAGAALGQKVFGNKKEPTQ